MRPKYTLSNVILQTDTNPVTDSGDNEAKRK